MKRLRNLIAIILLGGCASYSGSALKPGESRLEQVELLMGQPAQRWQDADGSMQLAYPRGPMGFHTFMARIAPDGRLQSIANVLDEENFKHIRAGMSRDEVLRRIGPPDESRSAYFKARDELAWEWRFREVYGNPAHFVVLFDASKGSVRSTMILPEYPRRRGSLF
ncbi:MAG: hypothetical protein IH604_01335 [Burkholderiales bacterium]|nr:hypothetical protein [Burkholderiales bacterium]